MEATNCREDCTTKIKLYPFDVSGNPSHQVNSTTHKEEEQEHLSGVDRTSQMNKNVRREMMVRKGVNAEEAMDSI